MIFKLILFFVPNIIVNSIKGQDVVRLSSFKADTTIFTEEGTFLRGKKNGSQRVETWVETNKSNVLLKVIKYGDSNIAFVITYHYNTNTKREEYFCVLDSNSNCKTTTGLYKSYYKSGRLLQIGIYNDNGKGNGEWIYYYENGNISQKFNLQNGVYEGQYESYYENGKQKSKGIYNNDRKSGIWLEYDINEKVTKMKYPLD